MIIMGPYVLSAIVIMGTTSTLSVYSLIGTAVASLAQKMIVLCIFALIAAYEILRSTELWNEYISLALKMAVFPLIFVFLALLLIKVA